MSRTNVTFRPSTAEGARASIINPIQQLRRLVMSCMLWEDGFYVDGKTIADNIYEAVCNIKNPNEIANMAMEARSAMNLRHAPLFIISSMFKAGKKCDMMSHVIKEIIQRPDEMGELIAIYWKDGKKPLPSQMKKGLALAFRKFNEYSLSKYNRDDAIKLRDVLFLCHAKPLDSNQDKLWKKLVGGYCSTCWKPKQISDNAKNKGIIACSCGGQEAKLGIADTWETNLSAGEDKRKTFTRLIVQDKLGGLALLRNLRNMTDAGVDDGLIKSAIKRMDTKRVLPFRFIAASKYGPQFEPELEEALFKNTADSGKIMGKTMLLVDVSASMNAPMSTMSDMNRLGVAYGLAMICREICDDVEIYSFSNDLVMVPPRRGFALRDVIDKSQRHGGTNLGLAVHRVNSKKYDRIIVITDEQSSDPVPAPNGKGYMINVASDKNGVGYGEWIHLDGMSESIIRYIQEIEK